MNLGDQKMLRILTDMFLGPVKPVPSAGYADLVPDFVEMVQVLQASVAIVCADIGNMSA